MFGIRHLQGHVAHTCTPPRADAPTLCDPWTTRDLAAHLVVRERRPDAAIGIVLSKAAGYTDKVQSGVAATEWGALVDTVRSGPPVWSPTRIGGNANTTSKL